ncbi:major facilitator superfamily domain-containing protein [Pelagophyceae sp. CCMP2097]|nr:major facilitator superfamily domain-containing protein [Pelagophyceae sp. CCMP2097]
MRGLSVYALLCSAAALHAPAPMRAVRRGHAQCQPRARALRATALPATALRAAAVEAPGDAAAAATGPEALMDAKLAGLGVSWYQALMVLFVASVYAADGAEVTVMSLVSRSLAEKYSLVSWQKGLLGMSVYSGMFAGGLVAGPVADSKGRSFTIVSATALISVFGVLSAYAPTFSLLCAARFVAGLGMGASLPANAADYRQFSCSYSGVNPIGFLQCLVFAGFNSGEYFAARAGKVAVGRADPATWLFLVAALPALLTFAAALIVPESPRFLAGRGNAKSVASWFKTAARVNGKKTEELFPEGLEAASNALVAEAAEGKKGGGAGIRSKLDGIFRGALKKRTLCLWLLW